MSIMNLKPLLLVVLFLYSTGTSLFAQNIKLDFIQQKITLTPNETKNIQLYIQNSSKIYGVELKLEFNPEYIQIIKSNSTEISKKVHHGDFFNIDKSFILQNSIDNEKGKINYLLTHIGPEKEVEGKGEIFNINIKAKAIGKSNIQFIIAKLGTKKGKVLFPQTQNLSIEIIEKKDTHNILFNNSYLIAILLSLLLLIIIFFKLKK